MAVRSTDPNIGPDIGPNIEKGTAGQFAGNGAARLAAVCLSLLILSGCAAKQVVYEDPSDPWENYNRHVFAFNEKVDATLLKPVAEVYRKILPGPVRRGLSNAFSNLGEIPSALNNLLQGDFSGSGGNASRFLMNTTLGVGGLFDPATKRGLIKEEEDFGQTLGVWGVGSGPYLMLPLLGPSTMRGLPGRAVDFLMYPAAYIEDGNAHNITRTVRAINTRAEFIEREELLRELSTDFYRELKNFYLNRRQHLIEDGAGGVDEDLYDELEEDEDPYDELEEDEDLHSELEEDEEL